MPLNESSLSAYQFSQQPSFDKKQSKPDRSKRYGEIDLKEPRFRKIFVGGLPHNLEEYEFRQYFSSFGELEDCVILKDKRTQKPRGFGFVTYYDINCVAAVMSLKDKHFILGKWVDCKSAIPPDEMRIMQQ